MIRIRTHIPVLVLLFILGSFCLAQAQETEMVPPDLQFKFEPETVELGVGDTVALHVKLLNADGEIYPMPFLLFARGMQARRSIEVIPRRSGPEGFVDAKVVAHRPGSFRIVARTITVDREDRMQQDIAAEIAFPPLDKIVFENPSARLYAGTTVMYPIRVFDVAGLERTGLDIHFSTSDSRVASVDAFGNVTAHAPGKFALMAEVDGLGSKLDILVEKNPVTRLELSREVKQARTGDVVEFIAAARDALGQPVNDLPIYFSLTMKPMENLGIAPAAEIDNTGRFVAETPGYYTIIAKSGAHADQLTLKVTQRQYDKELELVGHGKAPDVYTSDLWVWEGVDGRDYAVTGTWGANGEAYFWDVTDPANMVLIDTVTVDARTVNDVKVSEDGRIAVISREGASNRKNGFVILDVTNPRDVQILSSYNDNLTGGVHNVFIYEDHVYAVNNSVRYDIINIEDPTRPYRVSQFELNSPGHGIHDVWIENGIAFSSNWQDGLQLVDIGGVTAGSPFRKFGETASAEVSMAYTGGSPGNPVQFASYEYPSGWNHAAFPYFSESTGRFYVLAGDEAFPYGLNVFEKKPTVAAGWVHFVDFTDPKNPVEVARYEVPEAGSHNFWVEGDLLYAAFYNGGLRVVDISGKLKGDLYRQGREIDRFVSLHSEGVIPNAAMVWGPMPHKGVIFFSDMNSGLWAVKLVAKKEERN